MLSEKKFRNSWKACSEERERHGKAQAKQDKGNTRNGRGETVAESTQWERMTMKLCVFELRRDNAIVGWSLQLGATSILPFSQAILSGSCRGAGAGWGLEGGGTSGH